MPSQDTRCARHARAGRARVEAERVPRDGGEGGDEQAGQPRLHLAARPGAAAAAREAEVEDVHERCQRHVSHVYIHHLLVLVSHTCFSRVSRHLRTPYVIYTVIHYSTMMEIVCLKSLVFLIGISFSQV